MRIDILPQQSVALTYATGHGRVTLESSVAAYTYQLLTLLTSGSTSGSVTVEYIGRAEPCGVDPETCIVYSLFTLW